MHSKFFPALARWLGLAAIATAGLVSLFGSGGGGGGGDTPVLTVISTSPTNGATGVAATTTTVSATFSENLTKDPTITLTGGAGAVTGTVSRAGSTATFTPAAPLAQATTYTANVSGGSGASGGSQSGSASWSFTTVAPPGSTITVSGTADFQSVPNDTTANGRLLYTSITNKPIRGATVEVLPAAGGTALATGTTSSTGTYSLTIPAAQPVIVRVRAELKKTSGAGGTWDFTVRDNTSTPTADALYVLDSVAFTPTPGTNTQNLRALSGQVGTSSTYTTTRSAGPFAILDTVYEASQKLLSASPNAVFPPLKLLWSVNNRPASGNLATGLIGTSFYTFSTVGGHRIYILGFADTDTDEYDRAVVAHEFGHYFQSAFSRDDSIGGSHSGGDRLDMRVAFSEGWGNAWSGMALNTQYYTDSAGTGQQSGFRVDLAANPSNKGWFSEASVQYLLYQWHANPAIGFTPIFNVLAGMPTTLPANGALSSIHFFADRLKLAVPAQALAIDSSLTGQQILVTSPLGAGETNGGSIAEALPVYRTHTAAIGAPQQYCLTDTAGAGGYEANKLGANLFIRVTLGATGTRVINVVPITATSDPDFDLYRSDGTKTTFEAAGAAATETTGNIALAAGTHLIVLYDYALTQGPNAGTNNGQRCFNVTVN